MYQLMHKLLFVSHKSLVVYNRKRRPYGRVIRLTNEVCFLRKYMSQYISFNGQPLMRHLATVIILTRIHTYIYIRV